MNFYRLMHDAYYGGGGFEGPYLLRHPRESDENYRLRRRASYYLNYFAPIVSKRNRCGTGPGRLLL